MKSRNEISSPPFTNLATSAPLSSYVIRFMQLRQLIIARPLCGNRYSLESLSGGRRNEKYIIHVLIYIAESSHKPGFSGG